MAFNYDASVRSPSYTPAAKAQSVWGRPRTIEAIAIHWWGDPATKPTLEGVVAMFARASRQGSAHFVASGTGRKVANMVDIKDAAWTTNSANPYTISIECDPRCRNEDYDVVAELIAQIRSKYGNLPLVPHNKFVATQCPGNYDLEKLSKLADSKIAGSSWGDVKNKEEEEMITKEDGGILRIAHSEIGGWPLHQTHAGEFDDKFMAVWHGKPVKELLWAQWDNGGSFRGDRVRWEEAYKDLPAVKAERDKFRQEVREKESEIERTNALVKELQEKLSLQTTEEPSDGSFTENDRDTLSSIKNAVDKLSAWFKNIFNIGDK